ncbi:MAG: aminoglycoside phosphotransferase family protein [Rhizomicrobium sp.]
MAPLPDPPLREHIERWGLAPDGAPFETHSSWLVFVTRGRERAVLKVFKPDSDEAPSARYLALHNGHGTARVLESGDRAILVERIVPGMMLKTCPLAGRDDEATHIVCDTIEKLQSAKADPAAWPGHDEQKAEYARHVEHPPLTRSIVDRARALFFELDASQQAPVLLHGDLHHENILFDEARGWLAIDPKGTRGELAFELAAPLRNPLERPDIFASKTQMDRRVRIYCERLGLDRQRVLGWCFARNCIAALWNARHRPQSAGGAAWAAATLTALELLGG